MNREYLLWLFDYDKDRGVLIWKNHWRPGIRTIFIDKKAGTIDGKQIHLGYFNTKLKAHLEYLKHLPKEDSV